MAIKEVKRFITDDGKEHSSKSMAVHWDILKKLHTDLTTYNIVEDPHAVTNWIDDNRTLVKTYIDATELMIKELLDG